MSRRHRTKSVMSEINITPFTDVILVLLIIFMITTPLIFQSSIKVNLPQATTKDSLENIKPIHITITNEGLIYIGKDLVTDKELKERVRNSLSKNSDQSIILFSDQSVRFKDVVKVMDILNELGARKLNIATKTAE